ncbi:uncharacterized protein LOC105702705 [Orussus abietinus]|uniref:uncharacterized protein LOC105702705 n=1 Tax=Orussus abietinus TaxID=222816 RepID=UPI000625B414|nr:uncharacterized protein LOC105702705 [Orussus abietinus]
MPEEQQQSSSTIKATTQRLIAKQDDLAAFLDNCAKDIEGMQDPSAVFLERQIEELTSTWNNFKLTHAKVLEDPQAASCSYVIEADEEECERHFQETHRRDDKGRYIVRLPMKTTPLPDLRSSERTAQQQLQQLERRLAKSPQVANAYSAFMDEYANLRHMEAANDSSPANFYYMPHHAVIREASVTTKLRVVFNASHKVVSGKSLNDCLHTGPVLQRDLSALITKWRTHRFVCTADIEKMYRQIRIHPDDADLQRILWRKSAHEPITSFRLLTVTYGTACAPYLALRNLRQLAEDERSNFPLGAEALEKDFYVDDVLTGADDLDTALAIQKQLIDLLVTGGFLLRKWVANHPQLLEQVPVELRLSSSLISLAADEQVKTLGLFWNPSSDAFQFKISLLAARANHQPTKRSILSAIARLFDPLGWLAPVIITAKILIQRLWLAQVDWDQSLPSSVETEWVRYEKQLPAIERISIPRWTGKGQPSETSEIHGFCDASMHAYAAAVYLRTGGPKDVQITLLTAKTKVAPLKQLSIPRLELSAAFLLTRLVRSVRAALNREEIPMYAWTDSKVVLAWLKGHPSRWTCFVGNRVSEIQGSLPQITWKHVPSAQNPADCASRGLQPQELQDFSLWWNGPQWLRQPSSSWPREEPSSAEDAQQEERPIRTHLTQTTHPWDLILRYSDLRKLIRVTAYCRRFVYNVRQPAPERRIHHLTTAELAEARLFWLQREQQRHFGEEIQALQQGQPLPRRSSLLTLHPFLDATRTLRVGGRLRNAPLAYEEQHPAIIPKKSPLVSLLISKAHLDTLYGGTQLTLSHLLRKYWILGGRSAVRHHLHRCITCFRARAQPSSQLTGDLPKSRVVPARPFLRAGVDYAGPINLRLAKGRGQKTYKGYIALFICLVTKAIHIEVVSDYTSQAFIAAFKRFTYRRASVPSSSVTTGQILKELMRNFDRCSQHQTTIGRISRNIWPTREHTGLSSPQRPPISGDCGKRVEACLNSRPLSPLSSDPNDLAALTPGHFLIGSAMTTIPEPGLTEISENRLSKWQLTQRMHEDFWQRWSTEYLHNLQQRYKWTSIAPNLHEGMLALIKDERLPPTRWALARIIATHPGADGLVRVVTLQTATTTLRRPIAKVCPLPLEPSPATASDATSAA